MKRLFNPQLIVQLVIALALTILLSVGGLYLSLWLGSPLIPQAAPAAGINGAKLKIKSLTATTPIFKIATAAQGAVQQAQAGVTATEKSLSETTSGSGSRGTSTSSSIVLIATDAARGKGLPTAKTSFSNGGSGWLYLYVKYKNISGSHQQKIKLFTPSGYLYRTFEQSFQIDQLPQVSGFYLTGEQIPFGNGTWAARLLGQWTAKLYLDGKSTPTAQVSFTLAQ